MCGVGSWCLCTGYSRYGGTCHTNQESCICIRQLAAVCCDAHDNENRRRRRVAVLYCRDVDEVVDEWSTAVVIEEVVRDVVLKLNCNGVAAT